MFPPATNGGTSLISTGSLQLVEGVARETTSSIRAVISLFRLTGKQFPPQKNYAGCSEAVNLRKVKHFSL